MCAPAVALIVWRCGGMTSAVSHICSVHLVGILFIFELQNHFYVSKNFPLTFISSSSSPSGLLLWNIVGSQIIVWCWAAAALAQDISFSPCYRSEAALPEPQDRAGARSSLLTLVSRGHPGQRDFDLRLFSTARLNQNIPMCGMDVACNEALRNETWCRMRAESIFQQFNECQIVM